jgi:hypothetical protein
VTDIVVEFDSPASPVSISFGSVRLNKGAIIELAVADYIPCAPFGIHVAAVFQQIVDDVVFCKEKFVASPMSVFRPGTITIPLAIVSGHSHCPGKNAMSNRV